MGRTFKYVILGGGNAGGYAAKEFVELGVGDGELCIISEELVPPYERPALSKGYLLPQGAVRLPTFHTCVGAGGERQLAKWYKEHGIELITGTRVVAADLKRRALTTNSGETITYQSLILATGAQVIRLEEFGVSGADASNIFYLRDIQDADKLVAAMKAHKGGKAVVIGGGYIGMECAASLVRNDLQVTMVFPEEHCMARLFNPDLAAFYEGCYRKKGVRFIKGTVMSAFETNSTGQVTACILKDGTELEADIVVVGVGIRANVSLFEGQLLMEKGGIRVNGKMRTSISSVYAVGDCIALTLPLYGDVRRLEHVDHARKSAAHAVRAILTPDKVGDYDYLPFFYSRVFSLSWQFYGDNVGECIVFGDLSAGKFGAYWVKNGCVEGAFAEGGTQEEYYALARVARLRPQVSDLASLAEEGFSFALRVAQGQQAASQTSLESGASRAVAKGSLASGTMESSLAWQMVGGLAVAGGIVALAIWYRRRQIKLKTKALR